MSTGTKPKNQPGRRGKANRPAPPSGPSGRVMSEPGNPSARVQGRGRGRGGRGGRAVARQLAAGVVGPFEANLITATVPREGMATPLDLSPLSFPYGTVPRQLAGAFQRYFVQQATAHFVSACPYTEGGQLVMWWDNDPDEVTRPEPSQVASFAMSHTKCIVFPPTASRSLQMPPKWEMELGRLEPDEHFFYTNVGPERRTWVQAQLWLKPIIQPRQAQIGTITIRATYYFSNPGMAPNLITPGRGYTMLLGDWYAFENKQFIELLKDDAVKVLPNFQFMDITVRLYDKDGALARFIQGEASISLAKNPIVCSWTVDLNAEWGAQGKGWWAKLGVDLGLDWSKLGVGAARIAGKDTECYMVGKGKTTRNDAERASVVVRGGFLDKVKEVPDLGVLRKVQDVGSLHYVRQVGGTVHIEGGNLEPVLTVLGERRDDEELRKIFDDMLRYCRAGGVTPAASGSSFDVLEEHGILNEAWSGQSSDGGVE